MRRGVLIALALLQRVAARELWHLVLPHQKADKATRQALVDLEAAGRIREELRLPDGRKLWCLTRAGHREATALLPAGTRISALRPARDGRAAAYSEHALDVAATAGLLAKAGIGHLEAFTTEVEHAVPGRRSLFTDLVVRDPGADVPLLLVEVDRDNESAGELSEKLTGYRAWCELPAKGVLKAKFAESLRARGARTHELRLWRARYLATGREGLPAVALVLVPGRKRPRPGTKPPTEEEKREQARRDHQRLLVRGRRVEAATEVLWFPLPFWGEGTTARDYHRALPVVATTLALLRGHGTDADVAVWRRFGRTGWHTLNQALDNPDGDQLLAAQRAAAEQARCEQQAAAREVGRPACTRCAQRFTDERWAQRARAFWDDGLCGSCRQADAEQRERREAAEAVEQQRAVDAVADGPGRRRTWWRRS
ncbi:replication-relaxation family protein [Kitasatospora phosalacinea]|uniref:replication-relaxation family protein n=1 Tax=Kitasatospora phosalacinea TaxID=2065 RepID=UPI00365CE062